MRAAARGLVVALVALSPAACEKEHIGTVVGPPLLAAPPSAPSRPATLDFVEVRGKNVAAAPKTESFALRPCEEVLVAVVAAKVDVLGEALSEGDVLVAMGEGTITITTPLPSARVALGRVVPTAPCGSAGKLSAQVVRASAAPELTWAGGKMHAHLDVEKSLSPAAYMGRLGGAAPVAEHTHPDSWELICSIEATGTFRVDGQDRRMTSGECAVVPPGVKHQWTPDPGTSLTAVQMYVPPGPEQRFRALAAAATTPAAPTAPAGAATPDGGH